MVWVMDDTVVLPWLSSEESDMTVKVIDSGEEDVRLFTLSADGIGVEGDGEAADLAVGKVSRSTL